MCLGGKYCKYLSAGSQKSLLLLWLSYLKMRKLAILGDNQQAPERNSMEYMNFLEDTAAALIKSMRDLELAQRVEETEEKLVSVCS